MENKKLIKFLLKDLNDLEELVAENRNGRFDELEMEFLQSRLRGAGRMMKILAENETVKRDSDRSDISAGNDLPVENAESEKEVQKVKPVPQPDPDAKKDQPVEEKREPEAKSAPTAGEEQEEERKPARDEPPKAAGDVKLDEEDKKENISGKTLGEKFTKERSVNDLIDVENTKLEHKLSNRPVISIKDSIGINDRFQYIRELFDGDAEKFSQTVTKLDALTDINGAVEYMQKNFKWKKSETSLKFVNLVKRRFSV